MSFRRDGKSQHQREKDWSTWINSVAQLVAAADLPPSLVASEEEWWYFIEHGYTRASYAGREPWFCIDALSRDQNEQIWKLVQRWHAERCANAPDDQIDSLRRTFDPSANEHPSD